jgi:malate dehydrogenase (oxaloacetate-decarboxylating)(NADP+)
MAKFTKEDALKYHSSGKPGKIEVVPTKPYSSQRDLSLAYSPGVAEPCLEIEKDPNAAYEYTSKGNLVAVISNGTAVLGLGDIGAMAGKPVMEGKGLLFKIFAGIDVFDIEVNQKDPEKFIEVVKAISPTFGGINLEDIKAPECFEIEERLKAELDIPLMHDDQHHIQLRTRIGSGSGTVNHNFHILNFLQLKRWLLNVFRALNSLFDHLLGWAGHNRIFLYDRWNCYLFFNSFSTGLF